MKKLSTSSVQRHIWRLSHQISARLSKATGKTIWRMSQRDSERLIKLLVWEERYSVSLEYIFQLLVPYCLRRLPKEVRRKLESGKSLGVRISSLTSLECERYLRKTVEEEFPDGMNVRAMKEGRKQEMLAIVDSDLIGGHRKQLLQYRTMEAFVAHYKARIKSRQTELARADKMMSRMPYRLNPWL